MGSSAVIAPGFLSKLIREKSGSGSAKLHTSIRGISALPILKSAYDRLCGVRLVSVCCHSTGVVDSG